MPQAPPRSAPTPSEEPCQRIVEKEASNSSQTVLGVVPDWSYCNNKEVEEGSQVVDSPLDSSSGYYGNLPTEIVYSNTPAKRVYQVMLEYEKIDMKEKESPEPSFANIGSDFVQTKIISGAKRYLRRYL